MKKQLFVFLLMLLPFSVWAYDVKIDGIYYNLLDNGKAEVTYYKKVTGYKINKKAYEGNIVIPSSFVYKGKTYRVTAIGEEAFYRCDLLSINIPNSVTSIKREAFYNCTLTSVTIPNSVTSIGHAAFGLCYNLASITIPNSVTFIEENPFDCCASLRSISVEKGNNIYDSRDECNAIIHTSSNTLISACSTTIIPNTVSKIGDSAFAGCRIESISIPNSVSSIDRFAFAVCNNLTSITIPNSVRTIGEYAFNGKYKHLVSITIPERFKDWFNSIIDNFPNAKFTYVKNDAVPLLANKDNAAPLLAKKEKVKVTEIPSLDFVMNSIVFADADKSNTIQGGKKSSISFQVRNSGEGMAMGCKAKVTAKGNTNGIIFKDVIVGNIGAGQTQTIELPITAGMDVENGEVEFAIRVDEPNGFGTDPQYITVKTRAFEAPLVKITDYSLTANSGTTLKKKQPFDLQLMLQNTRHGQADDVEVSVEIPQNVLLLDGKAKQQFTQLKGGEQQSLVYSLIVNNNYTGTTIPVKVHVKERLGKYAEDRIINLTLDQALASTKIAVEAKIEERKSDVTIARLGSDVDKDIPESTVQQQKTFVVIIANEHYQTVESVPFASNDGRMFESYCRQTLGIPQQNIHTATDATLNQLKFQTDWLRQVIEAYDGEARAIFYYAGHGVPDEQSQAAYLLPVDGYASNISTGYPLQELYAMLGKLPAKSVTVLLDACFSGTRRDGKMLASARGVAIKAKNCTPEGRMVVFSASQGDETAYPYTQQQHGMFTYFLLKKLQQTSGDTTFGELADYVTQEVKRQSIIHNGKMQTPTVNPSNNMIDTWKSMRLK